MDERCSWNKMAQFFELMRMACVSWQREPTQHRACSTSQQKWDCNATLPHPLLLLSCPLRFPVFITGTRSYNYVSIFEMWRRFRRKWQRHWGSLDCKGLKKRLRFILKTLILNVQSILRISITNEKKKIFCGSFFSNRWRNTSQKTGSGLHPKPPVALFWICTDSSCHKWAIGAHLLSLHRMCDTTGVGISCIGLSPLNLLSK